MTFNSEHPLLFYLRCKHPAERFLILTVIIFYKFTGQLSLAIPTWTGEVSIVHVCGHRCGKTASSV